MMPALYLSHGAPPLVDDELWVSQLDGMGGENFRPRSAILVVSAHWEAAPLTIGSTTAETPLTYDFWGFPEHYYDVTYDAPGARGAGREGRGADARRRAGRPRPRPETRPRRLRPADRHVSRRRTSRCCRSRCPPSTRNGCCASASGCVRCATRAC